MTGGARGTDDAAVAELEAFIASEIDAGASLAAQYAIAIDGEVHATGTFGAATDEHRFTIFSATKTIVAMALLPHLADGSLDLTQRVADHVPEFGERGKHDVTVLQLLTMQGGFPQAVMSPDRWGTSAGRREQFAQWEPEWPAGTRTEYHPVSAHWVIGELIETLSGRPFHEVVHERVTAPAGADPVLVPGALDAPVVPVRSLGTHPGYGDDVLPSLVELFGRREHVPLVTIGPEALLSMNHPKVQAACIPGGGGRARAVDVARVYQRFLADDSPWMRDAVGTIRNASVSASDGLPSNRTIAGVVSGRDGLHRQRWMPAAPRAFGHAGAGGQLCWADPDTSLSFCFLHDTLQLDPRVELPRITRLNELALACAAR